MNLFLGVEKETLFRVLDERPNAEQLLFVPVESQVAGIGEICSVFSLGDDACREGRSRMEWEGLHLWDFMKLGCQALVQYLAEEVAGRVGFLPNAPGALETGSLGTFAEC